MSDYSLLYGKVFKANYVDDFDFEEVYEEFEDVSCGEDWIMFFNEITPCHEALVVPDFREFNERAHALNKNNDKISIDLSRGIKTIEYYYNGADALHVGMKFDDFTNLKGKK